MNVLILNQFIPPDPSPTAKLAGDVAALFQEKGHEVRLLAGSADYRGRGGRLPRVVREGAAWVRMLAGALAGPRPEVVVSFSSPPCLLAAAALAARLRGARLVHWAMDLYPDTAVALGALPGSVARLFGWMMGRAYARCDRVVALDADMAARLAPHCRVEPVVVPPWPPDVQVRREDRARAFPGVPTGARVWLYSGNLGRAHLASPLLEAQRILESRGAPWWLVFQGGGPRVAEARAEAGRMGLRQCLWLPYVAEERLPGVLLAADVLAVTRRPEVRGLLWPSKLAVAFCLPRPVVWIGECDSAAAAAVRMHGGSAAFGPNEAGVVASWLDGLPTGAGEGDPAALRNARIQGMNRWWAAVMGVAADGRQGKVALSP